MRFTALNSLAGGTINVNASVTIADWQGNSPEAKVLLSATALLPVSIAVPKAELEPTYTLVSEVRRYDVGLASQRAVVRNSPEKIRKQHDKIADHTKRRSEYDRVKNLSGWEAQRKVLEEELSRMEKQSAARARVLSQMLVRQTMYNRFDQTLLDWVSYYNNRLSPATPLDPNIIKSMAFEESRMGTAGIHLTLPPYTWHDANHHYLKSRFNIIQAIDSAEEQQLLMMEEMAYTSIFLKYGLDELKKEHKRNGLSREALLQWKSYQIVTAMEDFFKHRDSSTRSFMGNSQDLHEDYAFWLRTAIRWLFVKYASVGNDWSEAVRAYNGAGARARGYRDRVMARVGLTTPLDVGNE